LETVFDRKFPEQFSKLIFKSQEFKHFCLFDRF